MPHDKVKQPHYDKQQPRLTSLKPNPATLEDKNYVFNIAVQSKPPSISAPEVKHKKTLKDLDLRHFVISTRSYHDLIMKLIKIKESNYKGNGRITKKTSVGKYKIMSHNMVMRTLSVDTNLELDFESLTKLRTRKKHSYKIKGIELVENKPERKKEICRKPILYETIIDQDPISQVIEEPKLATPNPEKAKGVIRYKLSDPTFIDKGWTMLPVEKVVRKMNIYRIYPAHPEFDWFALNKDKGVMRYDTGEKLAICNDNNTGRWFYKNGRIALDFYETVEENCDQRCLVYSSGDPDERGRSRPITLLAMFDQLGSGVVFDHFGKIRLKYNQSEGVVLDREIGPASHWKWHSLNDPPILQRVMMENYMEPEDPAISKLMATEEHKRRRHHNLEVLAVEFENCIKEKEKKMAESYKPFQIKMKALKINEQFSLRIRDQANIFLTFKNGSANLKLNLGMKIDSKEILSTESEDAGTFGNSLEKFRDQTDSVKDLQLKLEHVRKLQRARESREQKIRPTVPVASVDRLNDALSRPLYSLRTVKSQPSNVASDVTDKRTYQRRPPCGNLYYNTRL